MKVSIQKAFSYEYRTGFILEDLSFDFYELVYIINGEGQTMINDVTYFYSPQMICFTKPGDVRHHFCTKKTEYICIRFYCSDMNLNLDSGLFTCHSPNLLDLFKKVLQETTAKLLNYYKISNLNVEEILYQLLRLNTASIQDEALLNLIRDIDTTFNYNNSVQEMADSVSYSYDHFRHKFKEMTGQPPATYVMSKRINSARKLLISKDASCTEIALLCDFTSSAQFSTLFKKYIGVTPSAYRNSYKGLY